MHPFHQIVSHFSNAINNLFGAFRTQLPNWLPLSPENYDFFSGHNKLFIDRPSKISYPKQFRIAALCQGSFVFVENFAGDPNERQSRKIWDWNLHLPFATYTHKDGLPWGQTNMLKAINKEGHSSSSSAAARLIGKKYVTEPGWENWNRNWNWEQNGK